MNSDLNLYFRCFYLRFYLGTCFDCVPLVKVSALICKRGGRNWGVISRETPAKICWASVSSCAEWVCKSDYSRRPFRHYQNPLPLFYSLPLTLPNIKHIQVSPIHKRNVNNPSQCLFLGFSSVWYLTFTFHFLFSPYLCIFCKESFLFSLPALSHFPFIFQTNIWILLSLMC